MTRMVRDVDLRSGDPLPAYSEIDMSGLPAYEDVVASGLGVVVVEVDTDD